MRELKIPCVPLTKCGEKTEHTVERVIKKTAVIIVNGIAVEIVVVGNMRQIMALSGRFR